MGLVAKAVKKVGKGIGKVVKGVAKGVKNVAKGIWKGVKGAVKGVGKIMGKLGPIGTLALSFALPGIGSMLGSIWTSASAYLPQTMVQAINNGLSYASNAWGAVKETVSGIGTSITEKIKGGLEWVGGNIKDGASKLWTSSKEFVGLEPKAAAKVGDPGKWIGSKAQESALTFAPKQSPLTGPVGSTGPTLPSVRDVAANQTGAASQVDAFVQPIASTVPAGTTPGSIPTVAQAVQDVQAQAAGVKPPKSFLDKALSSIDLGSSPIPQAQPFIAPQIEALTGLDESNRFGAAGTGAAGGQFVDPTILAMIQAQSKKLETLG